MMSKAHLEGFYQKPRVDRELLEMHSEGIYCLSGCMSGELASLVSHPGADLSEAAETIEWYTATFQDRYFLEIQRHKNLNNLDSFNRNLIELSEMFGVPLVATNDSHYVTAEHTPTPRPLHRPPDRSTTQRQGPHENGRRLLLPQKPSRDERTVQRSP